MNPTAETVASLENWIKGIEGNLWNAAQRYAKDGLSSALADAVRFKAEIDALKYAVEISGRM